MILEDEYSVFDFAYGISDAIDLVSRDLNNHHKQVAYLSYNIAKEMQLPNDDIIDIVLASIMHDIGAFTSKDRFQVVHALFDDNDCSEHQEIGYRLLRNFQPFSNAAILIRNHHAHYDKAVSDLPIGCYIVHLADRLSILMNSQREILEQMPEIIDAIKTNSKIFHPKTLEAFYQIAHKEYIWIEASYFPYNRIMMDRMRISRKIVDIETLRCLAKVIAQIIDFRSRFTSTHSSGVAAVAYELTKISGFSETECMMMEIAGYLHDIGKLAVSNEILEKSGSLNQEELNEMRKHSYFTYVILSQINGFEQIAACAAYHHERLDGNGYPFHIKGKNFTKLARIIAVADIVTAITEDRPYRSGMSGERALDILSEIARSGGIDKGIVDTVKANFSLVNDVRIKAQDRESQAYKEFYKNLDEAL